MAAYMKVAENGTLPFLGIRRPQSYDAPHAHSRRAEDADEKLAAVVTLWDKRPTASSGTPRRTCSA